MLCLANQINKDFEETHKIRLSLVSDKMLKQLGLSRPSGFDFSELNFQCGGAKMSKIIWIDTRQKPKQWDWLKEIFTTKGYQIKDDKPMTYGDYCMPPNLSVLVDTKYDIMEIVGNVIQQHERFTRELQGAYDMGAKLYILILLNS